MNRIDGGLMRNAECGMQNSKCRDVFRIPNFAFCTPNLLLIFFAVTFLSVSTLSAQEVARVRCQLETESPVWVGQRTTFQIDLLSSTFFSGTPMFDVPELPGLIIIKTKGSPVVSSEKIDSETWSVQRHRFSAFAHRPGKYEIPSFPVRFSVAPAFGKPPEEQRKMTEGISFEARLPDGAEGLSLLISTTKLEVKESWQPPIPDDGKIQLDVGDSLTCRIEMIAEDVPGMALPPIKLDTPEGIAAYAQPAEVMDREDRGSLAGQRIETTTFICEKAGTVTLPAITIPWWNLEANELNRISLPSVVVEINALPPTNAEQTGRGKRNMAPMNRWAAFILIPALILYLGWRFRSEIRHLFKAWKREHDESEPARFRKLKQACGTNDPVATLNSLMQWLDAQTKASSSATIDDFLASHPDPQLAEELTILQRASVRRESNWNGKRLARVLTRVRKQKDQMKRVQIGEPLPPLNPGTIRSSNS